MNSTKHTDSQWLSSSISVLKALVIAYSVLAVSIFLYASMRRLSYPYELLWFEGSALEQVKIILSGKNIYAAPTINYIPMIYPPLYYYISAILSQVIGPALSTLRIITITSSLGCFLMLYLFTWSETKSRFAAIISIGLFASTYALTNGYMDSARIDLLFTFLLLSTIYLLLKSKSRYYHLGVGVLLTLTILTKQTGLLLVPFLCFYYVRFKRKYFGYFLVSFAVLFLLSFLILNATSHGWYAYYVYFLPSKHMIDPYHAMSFFMNTVFCLFWIFTAGKTTKILKITYNPLYLVFFCSVFCISFFAHMNIGGDVNTMIPFYATIALLNGIFISRIDSINNQNKKLSILTLFFFIMLLLQFIIFFRFPFHLIPTDKSQKNTDTLNGQLHNSLIPSNAFLLQFADKKSHANFHMLNELLGGFGDLNPTPEGMEIINKVRKNIRHKKYDSIVLEKYDFSLYFTYLIQKDLFKYYEKKPTIYYVWKAGISIPVYVFVPKK